MKKTTFYPLLLTLFFLSTPLHAIVILVHGTFAKKEKWHQKGGDFYDAYQAINTTDTLYSFTWSGKLATEAHLKAAQDLCLFIIQRPYDEHKTLIGHSHGGSIINIASHLLDTAQYAVQNGYESIYNHIHSISKIFIDNPLYLQEDFPFSYTREFDETNTHAKSIDTSLKKRHETMLYKKIEDSLSAISGRLLEINNGSRFVKKRYVMHKVQLLATPILLGNYHPNMSIIQNLEHYYSEGDWIQLAGGLMKHEYPFHKNISQVEICFSSHQQLTTWITPDHASLHHPQVARWLANDKLIDQNVLPGKHYQLILSSQGSNFMCKEKDPTTT